MVTTYKEAKRYSRLYKIIPLLPITNSLMTRPIKFRAWDRTQPIPEMLEWEIVRSNFWWYLDDTEIELMQFTWLLDKNGKEIYEGDIIQYKAHKWYSLPDSIWEVIWATVWYSISDRLWRNHDIDLWDADELKTDILDHCEIIWNIYSNPELLKS